MGETGGAQQDQSAGRAELHGFNFLKRLSLGSKLTVGFAILVTLTLIVVALNYDTVDPGDRQCVRLRADVRDGRGLDVVEPCAGTFCASRAH